MKEFHYETMFGELVPVSEMTDLELRDALENGFIPSETDCPNEIWGRLRLEAEMRDLGLRE